MAKEEFSTRLSRVADVARSRFTGTHAAREQALPVARDIVRSSANSIRATHRGDFARARELLAGVRVMAEELKAHLAGHAAVYYGGFVEDALKEYVEAAVTLTLVEGGPLPSLEDLDVGAAPYMNGLSECIGELRRFILDSLRRDDISRCEELLDTMDEIYTVLVSMDFPEVVTRGLRRSTDAARGLLERTRGDLTVTLQQRRLERRLAESEKALR